MYFKDMQAGLRDYVQSAGVRHLIHKLYRMIGPMRCHRRTNKKKEEKEREASDKIQHLSIRQKRAA